MVRMYQPPPDIALDVRERDKGVRERAAGGDPRPHLPARSRTARGRTVPGPDRHDVGQQAGKAGRDRRVLLPSVRGVRDHVRRRGREVATSEIVTGYVPYE